MRVTTLAWDSQNIKNIVCTEDFLELDSTVNILNNVAAHHAIPASSKVPEAEVIPRSLLEKSAQGQSLLTAWPDQRGTS